MAASVDLKPGPVAVADIRDEPEPSGHSSVMGAIEHALSLGASTIHLSPTRDGLVIRARVDGVVSELASVPATAEDLADLGLRGRLALDVGEQTVELRSTSFPTPLGHRVTLRVVRDEGRCGTSLRARRGCGYERRPCEMLSSKLPDCS